MKLRHMTAEVVELEDVVIEENCHGEKIYHVYDSVKALKSYGSNHINTVRSMLLLEYDEVVSTEARIEIMKFDGWKVIG